MLKTSRNILALTMLTACGGESASEDACRLLNVDGDAGVRLAVAAVDFRVFATAGEDLTFLAGVPLAQRRYDSAVPTSLTLCRGATATPLTVRVFGTSASGALVAASAPTEIDFALIEPLTIDLSEAAIIAGDLPELVPSSQGLPMSQLLSDMKTPITAPGYNSVLVIGVGDGMRSYLGQGVMVSDAIADWSPLPPDGTQWRAHRAGLVVIYGQGHVDNGTWRIELANVDMQLFSKSRDAWFRPDTYPANPSSMFSQGAGGQTTGAQRRDGELPLSTIYTMPIPGTLGTSSPILGGATRPGYEDPGDGTDIASVFISAQARLVPSGVGTFDPSTAVLYLQLVDEILEDLTKNDGNYNVCVGSRLGQDLTTRTFTLFRDSGNAIEVQTPHNPARIDEIPTEAWLIAHPPIGIVP
ncbi:MAG TPA: hypothetical protein VLC93_00505 [Myxococcota bacterium]|nr:hypothetical protein [Myxococcota bacterium]